MGLKFGQIQTLVSVATDRVMTEKTVSPPFLGRFYSFSFLQVTMTCMRARTSPNFGLIWTTDCGVAALERLIKSP